MVVDWTELVLPALLATGAPCGAPAQPTIEMQPDKRHKKKTLGASYVANKTLFRRPIPAPDFAGAGKR